ncbi:hypothetical protein LTR56_025735 [Elasticomyces elasticus]|nr:hypothetical protein LTR56_025735 [Elasticomyces elasticus]KAK3653065.1 hypothetical protein LTR22_011303 [Elasticomyces elasticus]KAK4919692.1 hypothetical protein LTR49_012756 [Elasticomyces elasticus]KAK5749149.1 hypothetical protein LTS12_020772 [Elasticomyces elasticus]
MSVGVTHREASKILGYCIPEQLAFRSVCGSDLVELRARTYVQFQRNTTVSHHYRSLALQSFFDTYTHAVSLIYHNTPSIKRVWYTQGGPILPHREIKNMRIWIDAGFNTFDTVATDVEAYLERFPVLRDLQLFVSLTAYMDSHLGPQLRAWQQRLGSVLKLWASNRRGRVEFWYKTSDRDWEHEEACFDGKGERSVGRIEAL